MGRLRWGSACSRRAVPRVVALLAAVVCLSVGIAAAAGSFPMPQATGWVVWQAEQAEREGAWQVSDPSGAGERYVQPRAAGASLLFQFESDRPATLRIRPVWWPTGEQKLARRFPYPLVRQPGPDAIDYVGRTVFATAPAAGRVIAMDAVTEKVLGVIEVGGYLSDLVADRERGLVYVADALGDRLVAIDAGRRTVLGAFPVAGSPWALALHDGVGYVAFRDGRQLVGYDLTNGRVVTQFDLPAAPINLELIGDPRTQLLVRFQQQTYDLFTLEPTAADEQQFVAAEANGKPPPGCGGPGCNCRWAEPAGPGQLALVSSKSREVIDVTKVTGGAAKPEIVGRFGDNPGPASPLWTRIGTPPANVVFFTSPSRGRVGVFTVDSKAVESIDVGGYVAGIVESGGKLYVTDAAGNRVVVLDASSRKVEGEIAVPGQPWHAAAVADVAWQRRDAEVWPPTPVNRLYVVCVETRDLAAVDLATRQVAKRVPLASEPRSVKFVPMASPDWWPVMAYDRIAFSLSPRVAVELRPMTLDLASRQLSSAPPDVAEAAARRSTASVPVPGATKQFSARNDLLVGLDEKRWIDLSAIADPHRLPAPPLGAKETPGSITVSVDGGPEHDWAAGTWAGPDSEMFLVHDSESFWRYNAPSLQVGPGQHCLRVKANSQFLRLDAVAVRRSPEPELEVTLLPEPREVHGRVPLASYQGVFYDKEPVRFTLWIANRGGPPLRAALNFALTNYLGDASQPIPPASFSLGPGGGRSVPIALNPKETGRFRLTVTINTPNGQLVREMRFLRLPKLDHPRMFFRKEEMPAIRARIAQYPRLFRRYADWLERMSQKEGRFPERFLPPGITASELEAAAPEGMPDWQKHEACAWRMYELGWRMLAVEFATLFLKPEGEQLRAKVEAWRGAEKTDGYVQYHHHGPFFPGAETSLVDLAPDDKRTSLKLWQQFAAASGDANTMPWTLVTLEEPLTAEKRALIYEIMALENNAEQYFETHRGKRAGTWWQNPYTGCYCPMAGYMLTFLYLHNLFGEPRLFEKPIFAGYLTFQRYTDPFQDSVGLQPNRRGPNGEPWRWIFSAICRHPLEKSNYQWDEWIEKMNGPLPGEERAAVDKLMALEGMPITGPLWGGVNYFTSGVAVPVALALGWYDPSAPKVAWQELPPTTVFDVEGWVTMRSGWDAKATEVTFASGARDHTTRHKPNHFTIVKAGQYLIGTPSLMDDDGNNTGAWGNTVVAGDQWREQWALNLQHPRDGEHLVINRFSPETFTYIARDSRAVGYRPAEGGWGGGLDLHGHTETLFMREGRLLAYQTWPKLDFVAGNAENAWPVDQISQLDRQLVFLKPDLVVIYDRVKLGPNGHGPKWIAATGPELAAQGNTFIIGRGSEFLSGRVLLPEKAVVATPALPAHGWIWKDQKLLEVSSAQQSDHAECLVVMRVGGGRGALPEMELIRDEKLAGARVRLGGREIEVRFNREGPVGGDATVMESGARERYRFRDAVVDSYENWHADPRYRKWVSEPRFRFVVPQE